ncbi:MAG: hypothetical protein ACI9U2_001965, partial [Bradymonadia bacterium]
MADDEYDEVEGGKQCAPQRPIDRTSQPGARLQTVAEARPGPVAAGIDSAKILQDLRTQKSAL